MNVFTRRVAFSLTFILAIGLGAGCGSTAEPIPGELPAGEPFPVAFGTIAGIRELPDGRVLVSDPLGQVLVRINFATGSADTLGKPGSGPEEIGQPDGLFRLRGDSSLLVDLGNARLAKIGPSGTVLSTVPLGQQTASGAPTLAMPRAVDLDGSLYFRSERNPLAGAPNTTALLRFRPDSGLLDTLTMLKIPEMGPPPLPGGGGMGGKALQVVDEWAVGPNGHVLVVRGEDHTTLRIGPDGRRSSGPPIPGQTVPVDEEEKIRWLAAATRSQVILTSDESGSVSAHRGDDARLHADLARFEWPAELPFLLPGGVHLSPSGEAWLERYVAVGDRPLVYRLDTGGTVTGAITLPAERRVAGFGVGSVYLVHTDEYDLERLERYPLLGSGAEACTGFVLRHPDGVTVGKNLDWAVGDGILVVNERDVVKDAWNPSGPPAFSWTSRFGSVTFNQLGWGFPLGGINEAGLVVEEMSYSPSRYPTADQRPGLNELQWIQYQLDSYATVEEVLAGSADIRIQPFLFGLHYLVADRSGDVAVIEFLDGKKVVHTGSELPVPVLANDTYANSIRYLRHHQGFGGERVPTDGPESPERFVRAATMVRAASAGPYPDASAGISNDPATATFAILDKVRQNDTQWSIVYDITTGAVAFRTVGLNGTQWIRFDDLDFACQPNDRVLPLSDGLPTVTADGNAPWGTDQNRVLVELVVRKLADAYGGESVPNVHATASLAAYPSTARCRR